MISKEDYQGKEGSQPREGRKMTMGKMKDYQGKQGRLQGKEVSQPWEGRKSTKGR